MLLILYIYISLSLYLLNTITYNSNTFILFAICFAFGPRFPQSSGRCIDLDDDRRTHTTWREFYCPGLFLGCFFFCICFSLTSNPCCCWKLGMGHFRDNQGIGQGQKSSAKLITFVGLSSQRTCKRIFSMPGQRKKYVQTPSNTNIEKQTVFNSSSPRFKEPISGQTN